MWYRALAKPRFLILVPLLLLLIAAVACGEDATPTPQPTATPTTAPATPTAVPPTPTAMPKDEPTPTAMPKGKDEPTPTAMPKKDEPTPTAMPKKDEPTPTAMPKKDEPTPTAMPKADPTPTPGPAFFTSAKVDRLRITMPLPPNETNLPWKSSAVGMLDKRVFYENLVEVEATTGKYLPMLAHTWEMRPDGKAWTFWLNEGVQFHYGWGEFTSADVLHQWERVTSEESIATDAGVWARIIKSATETGSVDAEGPYQVTFNMVITEPDLDLHASGIEGNLAFVSKAQYEAEGDAGLEQKAAGTNGWRFVDRNVGQNILYERVEDHWRQTPEFKEMIFLFNQEDATRLAMMLTDEAHMTTLSPDLQDQAIASGMKREISVIPGSGVSYNFWGLYFSRPGKVQFDDPIVNIKVREAMNRAIDRDLIIDTVLQGRAEPSVFQYWHHSQQGWDPEFPALFEELYGYDVAKAKQLIIDAGYPNGFDITLYSNPWAWFPPLLTISEAIASMWDEIGIKVEIAAVDWVTIRGDAVDRNLHNSVQAWPPFSLGPPSYRSQIEHDGRREGYGVVVNYSSPETDAIYDALDQTVDRAERERLQRDLGRSFITNYATMPIAFVPSQVIIDPGIVEEYIVNGAYSGGWGQLDRIKAAR